MPEATVIDRTSGKDVSTPLDAISLNEASVVVLQLKRSDVVSFEQQGQDLVLRLASGETITIHGFFAPSPDGLESELVLQEDDGGYWWLRTEHGLQLAQYSELDAVSQLLTATSEGGAPLPILGLLGAGLLGGGLAAAGGGGGGSSSSGTPPPSPPPPPPPPPPSATSSAGGHHTARCSHQPGRQR